ncbi:metallophosphoesterase [Gluconacetobacter azotocaptans]|uniref:metallophosphoesterase family protein n=1 Tax=Gluconacetobacter azotocaptans TaxID=142834 RepID=UPI001959DDB1|nr:metallophosphoesterase [Gluconacetobacter azotocaptans]MBM9403262.1 metallophosphoesterase [Gluconacetobacter azotocaptans]
MTEITLAHLSDPHIAHDKLCLPPTAMLNKRALSHLSWRRKRRFLHVGAILDRVVADLRATAPDVVALTGDLTNLGLPAECRQAADWLRRDMPAQTIVIPGNHDMLVRDRWPNTLGLWAPWMAPAPDDFPFVRQVGPVALIGVNSARPMPCFVAAGQIGRPQADRLAAILHDIGRQGLCRVVMIHHPPVAGIVPPRKALLDAALFRDAIARAGAELVLHGHSHMSGLSSLPGPLAPVPVLGIASASMRSDRPERAAAWQQIRVATTERGFHIEIRRRIFRPDMPVLALPAMIFASYRIPSPI